MCPICSLSGAGCRMRLQSAGAGCIVRYNVTWVHGCALCSAIPLRIRDAWCGMQGAGARCVCGVHGAV